MARVTRDAGRPRYEAETPFMGRVIEYALLRGWLVHHCRSVWTASGYKTPIQGSPGFPDLCMTRLSRVVFAEIKDTYSKPTELQAEWLATLARTGKVGTFVWRPKDEELIWGILA